MIRRAPPISKVHQRIVNDIYKAIDKGLTYSEIIGTKAIGNNQANINLLNTIFMEPDIAKRVQKGLDLRSASDQTFDASRYVVLPKLSAADIVATPEGRINNTADYVGSPTSTESAITSTGTDQVGPDQSAPEEIDDTNKTNVNNETGLPKSPVGIDPAKEKKFQPQSNELSKFASNSYQASLHTLTIEQINDKELLTKKLPDDQIVVQTGGMDASNRNSSFNVDFYIDNINIDSFIGTKEAGRISNTVAIDFEVQEPYGLSFIERLAVSVYNLTGYPNYSQHPYLLTLKFFGYDTEGNVVSADIHGNPGQAIEKRIPIQITNITFSNGTHGTTYKVQAIPMIASALSSAQGVIQTDVEITADTVEEFFNNKTEGFHSSNNIETKGLAATLNAAQKNLVEGNHPQDVADHYKFEFAPSSNGQGIGESKITKPGDMKVKSHTPMGTHTSAKASAAVKSKVQVSSRIHSFKAGTPISEIIEMIVRQSTYITNQATTQYNQSKESPNQVTHQAPVNVLQWFRVFPKIKYLKFDEKRNTFAKEITYIIEPYAVHDVQTPEFNQVKFKGLHKQYNYWFTGENTEVLDFEQEYNFSYYTTFGLTTPNTGKPPTENITNTQLFDRNILTPKYFSANATETTQSAETDSVRSTAEAASVLYSVGDTRQLELSVMGDPAWLQTDAFFPQGPSYPLPFTPDGSVNANIGEIAVGLKYHIPTDYNLETGLQDPHDPTQAKVGNTNIDHLKTFSKVYVIYRVQHSFSGGFFKQRLRGYAAIDQSLADINSERKSMENENTLINGNKLIAPDKRNPVNSKGYIDESKPAIQNSARPDRKTLSSEADVQTFALGPNERFVGRDI